MKVGMLFKHIFPLFAIGWGVMSTFKYLRWHYRGYLVRGYARVALMNRNAGNQKFDIKGLDIDKILAMDVA
jgi:hypothetical protein